MAKILGFVDQVICRPVKVRDRRLLHVVIGGQRGDRYGRTEIIIGTQRSLEQIAITAQSGSRRPVSHPVVIRRRKRCGELGWGRHYLGRQNGNDLHGLGIRVVGRAIDIEGHFQPLYRMPIELQSAREITLLSDSVVAGETVLPIVPVQCIE